MTLICMLRSSERFPSRYQIALSNKTLRYRVTWIFWIVFSEAEWMNWEHDCFERPPRHEITSPANGSKSTSPGRQVKAMAAFSKSIRRRLR